MIESRFWASGGPKGLLGRKVTFKTVFLRLVEAKFRGFRRYSKLILKKSGFEAYFLSFFEIVRVRDDLLNPFYRSF